MRSFTLCVCRMMLNKIHISLKLLLCAPALALRLLSASHGNHSLSELTPAQLSKAATLFRVPFPAPHFANYLQQETWEIIGVITSFASPLSGISAVNPSKPRCGIYRQTAQLSRGYCCVANASSVVPVHS